MNRCVTADLFVFISYGSRINIIKKKKNDNKDAVRFPGCAENRAGASDAFKIWSPVPLLSLLT